MRRRILLLITDLDIGGTPTVVRELAARLNGRPDVSVEVACLAAPGPVADQLRAAGVTVTSLGATGAKDMPRVMWRLVRLLRRRRFDTVFSFLIHANAVAALAQLFGPRARLLQSVQTTQPYPKWHWRLQRLIAPAAERIVVPSPSCARLVQDLARTPQARITVIANAVDPLDFEQSPVPSQDPRPYPVCFIGRLDPIKGLPELLSAVAELKGLVQLHIYGEGKERAGVQQAIGTLKIGSHVTMHGAVAGPRDALARSGLLVLPSHAEGFGLVLIEAMAAGVPVIGRNAPGIRDVIVDGENGLLFGPPPRPPLATAIERVIADPALRHRLIEGGRRTIEARYTWEQVLPHYRRLLQI